MIETKEVVAILAEVIRNKVRDGVTNIFSEVRSLGRKMKEGEIQIIDTETYAGPDDTVGNYAYIRFRDVSNEHTFSVVKGYTSEPAIEVRAHLRIVAVHKCRNESELQTAMLSALLIAVPTQTNMFRVVPISGSQRGQTLLAEETRKEADFLQSARLCAIDFDLIYNLSAGESACNFHCDGCC